ncbi:MAG: hypothetical protein AAGB32_02240 [Pseudomonadota bacterium]
MSIQVNQEVLSDSVSQTGAILFHTYVSDLKVAAAKGDRRTVDINLGKISDNVFGDNRPPEAPLTLSTSFVSSTAEDTIRAVIAGTPRYGDLIDLPEPVRRHADKPAILAA